MQRNLIKKVQNTIFQYSLLKRDDKIIVAVSGGPDSTAMLDIFSKLKKKYDLDLIVAHVNYNLRGNDSKKDEAFARKLAEKYNLEIFVLRPVETQNFASLPQRKKHPSENTLRDIRYAFFEKIRLENKFDHIAVAHNADDQVETFLSRVIRGAGLLGLSAMRHKNNSIIRPLLDVPRCEILKYLKENKLTYRVDKTNLESEFLRNKIRNKLLPYLEKNFNPAIRQTIFDATVSISEDYSLVSNLIEKKYKKLNELDVKNIEKLHPAVQKGIVRKMLKEKKGNLQNIGAANIEEILKIIKSTKNKAQTVVFKGLKITRKGDKIKIE
ncbi:MAG: tRNA(Ile)-lysidine synthase [Patescibacteria group bacterium]|nr:tRNA(Ile)-lysidine synthase [Patescibacteria group bacterium]